MHKKITIVTTYAADTRIIANQGIIPWNSHKNDLRLKALIEKGVCIMGPEMFSSIYDKLAKCQVVVVSETADPRNYPDGVQIVATLGEAIKKTSHKNIFLLGGVCIFQEGLEYADTISATIIDYSGPGDRFFPHLGSEWTSNHEVTKDEFREDSNGNMIAFVNFKKNPVFV